MGLGVGVGLGVGGWRVQRRREWIAGQLDLKALIVSCLCVSSFCGCSCSCGYEVLGHTGQSET